jgi:hypothetical protein
MVNGGGCIIVIDRETDYPRDRETDPPENPLILILKQQTATNAPRSSLSETAEPLTIRGAQPSTA